MRIRSSVALIFIFVIIGAVIGRAMPSDAQKARLSPSPPSNTSAPTPSDRSCDVERTALASAKTQLAICEAFHTDDNPEATPPRVPPTDPQRMAEEAEEVKQNRKRLKNYSEAVIVQHFNGRTGVYKPEEWPIDGDGMIVARKLPSGDIAWYAGPDAGARSDPAAFSVSPPPDLVEPIIETAPDGTIMINGKPADNAVQRMFGGRVRPEQEPGEAP